MTHAGAAQKGIWIEHIMGTAIVVDLRDADGEIAGNESFLPSSVKAVFDHFRAIDARFSTYKPDSEVSRFNRGELDQSSISDELRDVMGMCETAREMSDGYFDIRAHRTDGAIDPSGLVKGWSVDGAAAILDAAGFNNYCINAAGDVVTRGTVSSGNQWRIGLRNPWDVQTTVAVVAAQDLAIATSGTYERGNHIIVPSTGRPPQGIASMTIVGPTLTWADSWATAAYAMGIRGVEWIASEVYGYEACAISTDRHLVMTPGFEQFMAER